MKKYFSIYLIYTMFTLTVFFTAASAQAEEAENPGPRGYYYYHSYYGQVPYGFGYFRVNYWPQNYWVNPMYTGYSYYNFYNYQPYYATYGVISYSPENGTAGYAYGFTTRDEATYAANQYCSAADCSPVVWVQGGCVAVAVDTKGDNLAWGYGNTKYRARAAALNSCRRASGLGCDLKSFVCSF